MPSKWLTSLSLLRTELEEELLSQRIPIIYTDADLFPRVHFDPLARFVFSKPALREHEADSRFFPVVSRRPKDPIADLFNPETFNDVFQSEGKRANGRMFIRRALNIISPNFCQVFSKILSRIHHKKRGNKPAYPGRMFFRVSLEGFLPARLSLPFSG